MTGPNPDLAASVVARRKERQSADMVEMRVAVEQVEIGGPAGLHQLVAQQAQAGAAVEHHQVLAAADLHARGVAAVAHRIRPRAGDAAAYSPEPYRVIRMDQGPTSSARALYRGDSVKKLYGAVSFIQKLAKFSTVFFLNPLL